MQNPDAVIIGGGLAGLITALQLSGQGKKVLLLEKKQFPFHKVCGEYVSNEVLPFLHQLGIYPGQLGAATISQFVLTSPKGNRLRTPLDLGGFGISRYTLDHHLYQLALQQGVTVVQTTVTDVQFIEDQFLVSMTDGLQVQSPIVVGAYGKRSTLDRRLERSFFTERSPYLAVKYHVRTQLPKNEITLNNFKDGYAGISAIEEDKFCFCYLTTRQNLKDHGTIPEMEKHVLQQNPFLKDIFQNSEFLYPQPEVINEISFAAKNCVENHILMAGDTAGLITPLCGNGMAMAIHSAKLASAQVLRYLDGQQTRQQMEEAYAQQWQQQFGARLRTGRWVQRLFGQPVLSELAVGSLKALPAAVQLIMRKTHGQPF
ncbi:FAD-dependent oxidoreductase [Rufibacter sp. DG15C]|uniref:NAD(P)/FAD-dependent oxidoreductase n=1 Tax=Rufibacter sp. DG15C TaxID=1379909 RepID=UPI00078E2F17|nr:FAD-dependent oxidoreductase [Rufibacter sp. DG15C]AMM51239.1 FAD-dependent oxidoreductase [Rufibacter sp. DG15C]